MVNGKSNFKKWVYVVWASNSADNQMKIDVRAMMDIPVATYLQNENGAHLWLYQEKKHYYSQQPRKLFSRLTKVSLDPKIFYSLLGVPRSPGRDWACKQNSEEFKCYSNALSTGLTVGKERKDYRSILIEKDLRTLRIKLSRSKVGVDGVRFEPLDSSQFKTIKI